MPDKMFRMAGRNEDGQAEALAIDNNGNLKTPKPTYKRIDFEFGTISPGETKRVHARPHLLNRVTWNIKHIVLVVEPNGNGNVMFSWRLGANTYYDEIMRLEGEELWLTPHGMAIGEIVKPNEFSPTKGVQLQQYIQQIGYISNDAFSYFELHNNTDAEISGVSCRLFVEEI